MSSTKITRTWDEPAGSASPRGWLKAITGRDGTGEMCVGFYLDYGHVHSRAGHTTEISPGTVVSFCRPADLCRDCQPGNILAVRYPDGPATKNKTSRYVETIEQARRYVETGEAS